MFVLIELLFRLLNNKLQNGPWLWFNWAHAMSALSQNPEKQALDAKQN